MGRKGGFGLGPAVRTALLLILWTVIWGPEIQAQGHRYKFVNRAQFLLTLKVMIEEAKGTHAVSTLIPKGKTCGSAENPPPSMEEIKKGNPQRYEQIRLEHDVYEKGLAIIGLKAYVPSGSDFQEFNKIVTEALGERCEAKTCIYDFDRGALVCSAKAVKPLGTLLMAALLGLGLLRPGSIF